MIKAVIFDIGDVLVNGVDVKADVFSAFGLTEEDVPGVYSRLMRLLEQGAIVESEFWRTLKDEAGLRQAVPEPSPLAARYRQEIRIEAETFTYVQELKQRGIRLAALSNTIPAHAEHLRELGLFEPFDETVLSFQVGIRKPDPEIYIETLDRLGVFPEEAVFVDNDPKYLEGASAVGLACILYADPIQLRQELETAFEEAA